ncbi:unnamed protein product [Chilo suppressalis]|uniref:AB hydrolase-1 domain-containing protein n=1 Tax=Chilo suppressalis TaxID=168631 RepID=A0ABN8L9T9_CHISP|nr:unnamed protein product [Chilo suppressalis]
MSKKITKEWCVDTVWGKVAMVSWGDPARPPVLLLHGFLDTAATFIPLLEHLPDTYYYVGYDNPGHGKSDPYPIGPLATQVTLIEVIRAVASHLQWNKFMMITHSMGFINAIFYHSVYPGRITSMVNLDPLPAITNYYALQELPATWFGYFYESHWDEFAKFNRQNMVRKITQFPVLRDMLVHTITHNPPRMLNLVATHRSDSLGLFYNAIYPNKISKFILFDPMPSLLGMYHPDPVQYYSMFYEKYYSNYREHNSNNQTTSKRKAIQSVMRARGVNESQAELVLSRNLEKVGDNSYSDVL